MAFSVMRARLAGRVGLRATQSKSIRVFSASPAFEFGGWWNKVEMGPKDPILGVSEAFKADTDEKKLNLGVGAYRNDSGKPVVLPAVLEAQDRVNAKYSQGQDNEYAPISGSPSFTKLSVELAYGKDSEDIKNGNVSAIQTLSGTGALRLIGEYISRFANAGTAQRPTVFLPNPTWGNHFPIFQDAGLPTDTYRYYDPNTKGLDFDGMVQDIQSMDAGSVVLLHACAHNPTGVDPTPAQWAGISTAAKEAGVFVIFDCAYQGFASGDCDRDVTAIRQFVADGHRVALCQSFAKNFGLYGQRVGCLSVLCDSAEERAKVDSQLKILARPIYSSPPLHGARIVEEILSDDALTVQWKGEVKEMAQRIIHMRTLLADGLKEQGSVHDWSHVTDQIGMFCFSGLTPDQVDKLTDDWHIYMTKNGRISMAGVTSENVSYLAEAVHAVTK